MGKPDSDSHSLLRGSLPDAFERRRLVIAPGAIQRTAASEWAGALVQVERGTIEVGCLAGGSRTFVAGDLLALGWLELRTVSNPGPDEACLVAVRRRIRD